MPTRKFDPNDPTNKTPNNNGGSGNGNNTTPTPAQAGAGANGSTQAPAASSVAKKDLPKGLIDMHTGNYRPVLFRDKETMDLVTVLNKADKPNALLIGKAGAGKTAIAKNLAKLIDQKDPILPDRIQEMHLYELSLNAISAGNSLVGQTEQAIQDIVEFATEPDNHAVIFVDEVHQLFEQTDHQMGQLAQALKPAMARDNFRFIGATTTGESKTVLKDPAMSRRVEEVRLHDLTLTETTTIVEKALPRYRKHHNVIIEDDLAPVIVKLADQNYLQSARPDNALSLIDQAASLQAVSFHKLTANLPDDAIAVLPDVEHTVTKEVLIETIDHHNGSAASVTPLHLQRTLERRVKGQDKAIEDIAKRITLFRSNIIPSKNPLSLLLSGPTGNGKTETAKAITKALFNDMNRMTTINMTEYGNPESINQLIGSPDGYVGSDSKRTTPFDAIYENPAQVLLLDEFEKAHKDIHHLFYQILEEGFIEDRRGRRIDFSKTILIFTSNAATEEGGTMGFQVQSADSANKDQQELITSLKKYIPDALLNRMTRVYKYESISKDAYRDIIRNIYVDMVDGILENRPEMNISEDDLTETMLDEWVEASYDPQLNGRPARNFVKTKLEEATLDALMNNSEDIVIK